ncbi:MAG: hypothetical protein JWN38_405 [Candidatus Saccharibacteria bacterium]|nr:hypothetical protein [Candidatus Saccharibacteria bacterium]
MPLAEKSKKTTRPAAHHKKRVAAHHKKNKDYLKHYWPYIPMLLVVVVGLAVNSLWSSAGGVLGASSDFSADSLLASTNSQRLADHESGLTLNAQLTSAAQTKANDMVARNYWSHNTPDGKAPWTFIIASGYNYEKAGENLAYGFDGASQTITGWMNSPEHRANILNAGYKNVGFGVAESPSFQGKPNTTVVVAMYASPGNSVSHISFSVPETTSNSVLGDKTEELNAQPVSRIQILSGGGAAWTSLAVSALAGIALVVFMIRHGYRVQRLVTRGEFLIVSHPYVDIGIVVLFTLGFILTRTSGIIR